MKQHDIKQLKKLLVIKFKSFPKKSYFLEGLEMMDITKNLKWQKNMIEFITQNQLKRLEVKKKINNCKTIINKKKENYRN